MKKLYKAFMGIYRIICNPWLLNNVINDESVMHTYVTQKYSMSNGLPLINIMKIWDGNLIHVEPFSASSGGSTPMDLLLLKALCLKFDLPDYLEIGTWRGESVANVASVAQNCVTVNLPDDEMRCMGLDEDYIQMHRHYSKNLKNVTHLYANSQRTDIAALDKKYDLIFIDGDHHREAVARDTATAFKMLKNERSIIVWHDYANDPESVRWSVLSGILDGCPSDQRNKLFHISNTLCAVYMPHDISSSPLAINKNENTFSFKISKI